MANCSDDAPKTNVFYDDISDDALIIAFITIACILATVCCILYVEEIFFIRKQYNKHDTRGRKSIILLGLYPVVCVMSLIAILVPTSAILLDLVASGYLSICIYVFITMTIECFGGSDKMVEKLSNDKVKLNTPPCCCCLCCILKPITLTKESLCIMELLSMQVAFVRPAALFVAAILWTDGQYIKHIDATQPYVYITVISGISMLVSMYGMIVIFRASKLHLAHYHLAFKFIPLQLIIVLVNVQSGVFSTLADRGIPACRGIRGSRVRAAGINNGLLVVEAFLCCLLARKGYRTKTPNKDEILEHLPDVNTQNNRHSSEVTSSVVVHIGNTNRENNEYGAHDNIVATS
ncbi:hypothetical protein ACF0H5_004611 [Mactra antiquata]